MGITMQQLADIARVSRATVDRALNNRGRIDEETAKRIRELADKFGYTPNIVAKSLATRNRQSLVSVIINTKQNIFFSDVIRGIETTAREMESFGIRTDITHTSTDFSVDDQLHLIDAALEAKPNVLIITPIYEPPIIEKLRMAKESGTEVIAISADITDLDLLSYVGSDHLKAGRIAGNMATLTSSGHPHFAVVIGSRKMLGHKLRLEGFESVIRETLGNDARISVIENEDDNFISYDKISELLCNEDIDMFFFGAAGTEGGIKAIERHGRHPRIIAFDLTEFTKAKLKDRTIDAIIYQNPYTQGRRAMQIANDYILKGIRPGNPRHYVDLHLLLRESL